MKTILAAAALVIALSIFAGSAARNETFANDVSWPNCGLGVSPSSASGIVGINGGKIYTLNPCFDRQITWFKNLAVYLNTGYPGLSYAIKYAAFPRRCSVTNEPCLAYNYGFNAAKYSINAIRFKPVLPSRWWLDVETANSWSDDTSVNRKAISGMISALNQYAAKGSVGIYSAPRQWRIITGGWQNSLPAWVATGSLEQKDAIEACKHESFNGGPLMMAQYTLKLDENFFCRPDSFQP